MPRLVRRSKFMKPNGPTSRLSGDCAVESCKRPLFRQGYCSAHFKRKQRNKEVDGPIGESRVRGGVELGEVLSAEEVAIETGNMWLETPAEDDALYKFRKKRFLKAAAQWLESLGWQPPHDPMRRLRRA